MYLHFDKIVQIKNQPAGIGVQYASNRITNWKAVICLII